MLSATLLTDGKEAFPALLRAIDGAKESLTVNMFIWRDDTIGNRMADPHTAAALIYREVYGQEYKGDTP